MEPNSKNLLVELMQPRANPALAAKQHRLLQKINSDLNSKPPGGSSDSLTPGATPAQPRASSAATKS